jgi:phage terminase small subunit
MINPTDKLTDKQQRFIDEYLSNGFNATQAAISAGYSEKTARSIGCENLTKPNIRAAVDARLAESAMSANEVLARLADHARGSMADFLDDNRETLDLAKADRLSRLHLIKKFTHTKGEKTENLSIELYDAQAALVQLGRYHKLFTDKQEITGEDGGAIKVIYVDDWRNDTTT